MTEDVNVVETGDKRRIGITEWDAPAADAVVVICHGLSEHHERYARLARELNRHRFHVAGYDHRGHGPRPGTAGYFAAANGWDLVVQDLDQVVADSEQRHPGMPVVVLGHSMGSYIAQAWAMRHSARLSALVLSGSTAPNRLQLRIARLVAHIERRRLGPKGSSGLLHALSFGAYNRRFKPARTEFDWLSRDTTEVDDYISDPLCGGAITVQLWLDLLGGLLEISARGALDRIRDDLPVLIVGGSEDPISAGGRLGLLRDAWLRAGVRDVSLSLYQGARPRIVHGNEPRRSDRRFD